MWWLMLGLVLAADPEAEAEEAIEEEESVREVVVYGWRVVEEARKDVIEAAKSEGYTIELRKGDRTIMRHEMPWKGEVVMWDDGRVQVKRQPIRFEPPGAKNKSPAAYLWCVLVPLCIRPGGQTVSPRRFRGYERGILAAIDPGRRKWNDAIADATIDAKLDQLPDNLAALWDRGVGLDGSELGDDFAARRAALFAFWNSRTETPEGERIRDGIESFLRGVVQVSDNPFTHEEIEALNAVRRVERVFLKPRRRTTTEP